jgi:choline dehydrogenase
MNDAGTFDYIVTGAGSAGCCVAAWLSESGRYRVLLLEAGPEDKYFWIHVPSGYSRLFANPRVNWMFESEPEPELENRRMYQPRGKVLGGTSSINGMVYMRGNPADYDLWRQRGCTGWDWDSVLPYFRKAEDQERGADPAHGVGGPLRVSDQAVYWELGDKFIAAGMEAGLPRNDDFNDGEQEGVGPFQNTTNRKQRWSTATAYLKPARDRGNLTVSANSHATRIVVTEGKATAVEFLRNGEPQVAQARGEIIVCGGVYGSPQLLQLSGLGPGAHLQEFGIPVVRDMAGVGADLQDHFYVRAAYRCTQPITLNDIANSPVKKLLAGMQYVFFGKGPLTSNGICAGGFARSDNRLERPDLQFNFSVWSFAERTNRGVVPHPHPGFTISAVHLRPDARGSVRLKSADPAAAPSIRFNFLKTQYDLDAMTAGMRWARKFTEQPSLRPYVAEELLPGLQVQSDADFEAAIRRNAISNLHPVGTCHMGTDPNAVCDPRLRVNGVSGLRVVDAAVMPSVPAGNTNAPTIMIAEKASEMILEDARAA